MSEWRTIDSAPTDEYILVFVPEGHAKMYEVGRYYTETHEWWETVAPKRKELQSEVVRSWSGELYAATHWMPLPSPPESAPKDGTG